MILNKSYKLIIIKKERNNVNKKANINNQKEKRGMKIRINL